LQGTRMFEPSAPMMRVTDQQKVDIKAAMKPLMA
jgi:hypothetical protein